jgi:hypothetical protein
MKTCSKCGETKTLEDFYNLHSAKDGKQGACKTCQNAATYKRRKEKSEEYREYQRKYFEKYREENRERLAEYSREYREENKDSLRAKRLEWLEANPGYNAEYCRKYYADNRNELRSKHREYYERNPELFRHHRRLRRSRILGSKVTLTSEQEAKIYERFGGKCALTGASENIHLDHFIPVLVGGDTSLENMVPIAGHLNISKHAKNPFEWIRTQEDDIKTKFDEVVEYLAKLNGFAKDEYEAHVYNCFD